MGRRGPSSHTPAAKARISEGVRASARFQEAMASRIGQPRDPDNIEIRAKKAASKYACPGTKYWREEFEMALERIAMLERQAARRRHFLNEHTKDEEE